MINLNPKNLLVSLGVINSDKKNAEIRDGYNKAVSDAYVKYVDVIREIHENHQSVAKSVADEASAIRYQIKQEAQGNNTFAEKAVLFSRDMMKSVTSFFSNKTQKNSEEATYSAFKTGGGDLGLKNNGFDEVVKAWKVIDKNSNLVIEKGIYPESMNAQEAKEFNLCYKEHDSVEVCVGEIGITGLYEA